MNLTVQPEDLDLRPSRARGVEENTLPEDLGLVSEKTRTLLYDLARSTPDADPAVVSIADALILASQVEEVVRARDRNQLELASKFFGRARRILLAVRKSEAAKRTASVSGGLKHFKAPPIKFPNLDIGSEFRTRSEEDTIKVYRWATSIKNAALNNNIPKDVSLEMAKDVVPASILIEVQHAQTLDEFFSLVYGTCPKASLAVEYIKKKLCVDYEGGYMQDGLSTANDVVQKAMTVAQRLTDLECINARLDVTPHEADIILQTFGTTYGGTASEIQRLVDEWRVKYENDESLLVTQLKKKVDVIRKNAYNRSPVEKKAAEHLQPLQATNKVLDSIKRQEKRIASLETFQKDGLQQRGSYQGGGGSAGQGQICWVCGAGHSAAACKSVLDSRNNNVPLPSDVCKFCLHRKKDGEKHHISAVDGCHIGPASIRQKNLHKDSKLKRDNLCYEHKMSYLIDQACYLSTEGGKKANTFREPRYIRSQEK